ncbi:MAG: holo-ACP synthase [Parachlamydiaceae bacterium]
MTRLLGLGNDIIEIQRIARALERHGQRFLDQIFTIQEQTYCLRYQQPERCLAGRFAAKEAIVKALGTGFSNGISWHDIEILNNTAGKPVVYLSERLKKQFQSLEIQLSISHSKEYATAVAIAYTETHSKDSF